MKVLDVLSLDSARNIILLVQIFEKVDNAAGEDEYDSNGNVFILLFEMTSGGDRCFHLLVSQFVFKKRFNVQDFIHTEKDSRLIKGQRIEISHCLFGKHTAVKRVHLLLFDETSKSSSHKIRRENDLLFHQTLPCEILERCVLAWKA